MFVVNCQGGSVPLRICEQSRRMISSKQSPPFLRSSFLMILSTPGALLFLSPFTATFTSSNVKGPVLIRPRMLSGCIRAVALDVSVGSFALVLLVVDLAFNSSLK